MKTYDDSTNLEVQNPDLTKGYVYSGRKRIGTEKVLLNGTVDSEHPTGFFHEVPKYEECQYYHAYTQADKENALNSKLEELKSTKDSKIQNGADVTLSDGTKKHFYYGVSEQTDIGTMFNAVMLGMDSYIYHSNDGGCTIYSREDIIAIHSSLSSLKTKEETYYGQLSAYVKTLETAPEIQKVSYDDALTGSYLEEYNRLLSYAMTQMQKLIERLKANAG